MKYYVSTKLSDNLSETPEGYLLCLDVPLARTGELLYSSAEIPGKPSKNGIVTVNRTPADIFNEATISSFEGKPVTMGHPNEFVGPDNWQTFAVGIVQNVRPGLGDDVDKLLADLLITDREAIFAVKNGTREVSCGYNADHEVDEYGIVRQIGILGNHLAIVPRGRCGAECAIFDHDSKHKGEEKMTIKDKIMKALGIALDSAIEGKTEEELKAEQEAEALALEAEEKAKKEAEAQAAELEAKKKEEERLAEQAAKLAEEEAAKVVAPAELTADEIAGAEILCPGIAKTFDAKEKALESFYATEEGKKMLDVLTAGKAPTFDAAGVGPLFNLAVHMVKLERAEKLASTKSRGKVGDVANQSDYAKAWNDSVSKMYLVK
jgi:uncharacterized protein